VSAGERAYAARVAVDAAAASSATEVPGGILISTPELPRIWDLNQVLLAPGARAELVEFTLAGLAADTMKLSIFDPADPVPAMRGFRLEHCLLMMAGDEAVTWPESVEQVPPADLRATRVQAYGNESDSAEALGAMFDRYAAASPTAALVAARAGVDWAAWASIANGAIDDVWVQPPFRRRGLGRAVTQGALAAGGWFLYTDAADPVPQGLYRSLGMREIGTVVLLTRDGG
jgi:ribosomal protein S18 acetylase RimI-like enzyme